MVGRFRHANGLARVQVAPGVEPWVLRLELLQSHAIGLGDAPAAVTWPNNVLTLVVVALVMVVMMMSVVVVMMMTMVRLRGRRWWRWRTWLGVTLAASALA